MKKPEKRQRRSWTRGVYRKASRSVKTPVAAAKMSADLAALRPRERLDAIHAMQALLDLKVRKGELVEKSEVEAGHAEMRELIRNDLVGSLPMRLAGELSGRALDPAQVRAVVLNAVRDMIRGWAKADVPVEAP